MATPRGHVLGYRSPPRQPTDVILGSFKPARWADSNGTSVISVGHVVEKLRPILSSILVGSETYVTKKWKKLGSPVRLPLMLPNSSRAYFDPLNEINGTYKRNFLELLVKIVNNGALKGLQSRFWPATLYTPLSVGLRKPAGGWNNQTSVNDGLHEQNSWNRCQRGGGGRRRRRDKDARC